MCRSRPSRLVLASALFGTLPCLLFSGLTSVAAPPQVRAIQVYPPAVRLSGRSRTQSFRVLGTTDDGRTVDVTADCKFAVDDPSIAEWRPATGLVSRADGKTALTIKLAKHTARVPIEISNATDTSVAFTNDVLPAIDHLGCNQMGCHGSPKGKKRLHLSLFCADPHHDFLQITDPQKQFLNAEKPAESLLLQKAICDVDHGGGDVTEEGSLEYDILFQWIAQGAKEHKPKEARLERIEVFPAERRVLPNEQFRLLVEAYYTDGTMRDVTALARFKSTEEAVARVAETGAVTGAGYGESVILVSYAGAISSCRVTSSQPAKVAFPKLPIHNPIDELVDAKLRSLNIVPSQICSDEAFVRRVYLDVLGCLPTADEARRFLADRSPNKRSRLINELLDRPEYADFYAVKWGDILQISRDNPARLQDKGVGAFYRWLWHALDRNMPMDQFAHELLTATGSGYRNGPANFFRIGDGPQGMAEHASTVFLGVRLDCAHCHNHPFEQFTWDDNLGMAAFFAGVKLKRTAEQDEEIVYLAEYATLRHPESKQAVMPKFLGGRTVTPQEIEAAGGDARVVLVEWMTSPENPYFARNLANRVWAWLMGRGIVHEPDDFRSTNPPSNPELLDFLAGEFIRSGYDLKAMYRLILNSRTYQLSAQPNQWNEHDRIHYSHYRLKRLTAEQLADAITQVTGVPQKYPGVPLGTRAMQLRDVTARSEFLDLFGRPKRATPVESERTCETHIGQSLELVSSDFLAQKLRHPAGRAARLAASAKPFEEIVDELYLMALARYPTEAERQVIGAEPKTAGARRAAIEDLMWVLMNTKEFLFNH